MRFKNPSRSQSDIARETVGSLVGRMRNGPGFRSIVPEAFADDASPPAVAKPAADDDPRNSPRIMRVLARLRIALTGGSRP